MTALAKDSYHGFTHTEYAGTSYCFCYFDKDAAIPPGTFVSHSDGEGPVESASNDNGGLSVGGICYKFVQVVSICAPYKPSLFCQF